MCTSQSTVFTIFFNVFLPDFSELSLLLPEVFLNDTRIPKMADSDDTTCLTFTDLNPAYPVYGPFATR